MQNKITAGEVVGRICVIVCVLCGSSASVQANSCAEVFTKAGTHTIGKIDAGHPEIGIRRTANGYTITSNGSTLTLDSIPALLAILTADAARSAQSRRSLELYFQGMDKQETMNLVSTL